ncbi:MAG: 2-hydroxyacyl-CoA dehydratase family protein [Planctomycetota bacterium]|jgi:benzoyl-CoA reductase/2-hydroxyglutaryl-CoA dehydratase subunit BcrC/BadD/HgdB
MKGSGPRIGITTTIPVEVVFAAGLVPVDLNNIFITSPAPRELVEEAEARGLPRSSCAWLKGVYTAARRAGIDRVIGVVHGDCSGTQALLELLASEGLETVPFAYPVSRDPDLVLNAITDFAGRLGVSLEDADAWRVRLLSHRRMLAELDEALVAGRAVTGAEAHAWMVSSSDFRGDPEDYGRELRAFLDALSDRPLPSPATPVALAGVPPIAGDFFEVAESVGLRIAYNEVPAEFTMMHSPHMSLQHIYCNYSYPYDAEYRLARLAAEIARREARGVIHYLQTFCHRQIGARLLRERLPLPVLELECDRPGRLDSAARGRLESFAEMLRAGSDGK